MRVLTRQEATVVWLLLARSRRQFSHVPGIEPPARSTLKTVRKRVYQRGWVRDGYVPAPAAFGLDRMTFALARPPVDQNRSLVQAWQKRPENVLLWGSSEGVFGVFLSNRTTGQGLAEFLSGERSRSTVGILEADCRRNNIPVYFDFELAWIRANGLPGVTLDCPRPVPEAPPRRGGELSISPSGAQRAAIRSLLTREGTVGGPPSGSGWLGRGLEERIQRLGWVAFRPFLNPVAVATSVTGFPDWLSFAQGRLLAQARPTELFRALVGPAAVSPFLFATDGRQVLFAVLSMGPGARRDVERVPVLRTLETYLEDIVNVTWPLASTRIIADHEYDRALGATEGEPAPPA